MPQRSSAPTDDSMAETEDVQTNTRQHPMIAAAQPAHQFQCNQICSRYLDRARCVVRAGLGSYAQQAAGLALEALKGELALRPPAPHSTAHIDKHLQQIRRGLEPAVQLCPHDSLMSHHFSPVSSRVFASF